MGQPGIYMKIHLTAESAEFAEKRAGKLTRPEFPAGLGTGGDAYMGT